MESSIINFKNKTYALSLSISRSSIQTLNKKKYNISRIRHLYQQAKLGIELIRIPLKSIVMYFPNCNLSQAIYLEEVPNL